MENLVLAAFALVLFGCVITDCSVVYGLLAGYLIFALYVLGHKKTLADLGRMSFTGIRKVKNILIIFLLIGMMTAVWRAAGTIPAIIFYTSNLIIPSVFILMVFLLNCMVSVLTGTAFGTAATMGVICMTMANAMNINPLYTGGAVFSGIYFGDRCSPMSTSALLVCELTGTNVYDNIKNMIKTSAVPFTATCLIYLLLGLTGGSGTVDTRIRDLFFQNFGLYWYVLLPVFVILFLSCLRINVKYAMAASIVTACWLCLTVQKISPVSLLNILMHGYHVEEPELARLIDGGGILSMVRVSVIICISSAYSGIFDEMHLLDKIKKQIVTLGRRITPFGSIYVTSVLASMVACNQTLAIMLTSQLCQDLVPDNSRFAVTLENTAVVAAPLIPWSIAAAVPISTMSAPAGCLFFAFYLYLIPLWNLFCRRREILK